MNFSSKKNIFFFSVTRALISWFNLFDPCTCTLKLLADLLPHHVRLGNAFLVISAPKKKVIMRSDLYEDHVEAW